MGSTFYSDTFSKGNISVIVPNANEQEDIQNMLMSEIAFGIIKDKTRDSLIEVVQRMKGEDQIEGIILGCTELPLILDDNSFGIPVFNTTEIHVESIVRYCKEG